jgi:phage baseplate assembly protein W
MRDLQIQGGDLVLGARGFGTVTGTAYLQQRIATALEEPYGSDPFNPQWGSVLLSYIGRPVTAGTASTDTSALVSAEVARVLQQLMAAQQAQITSSVLAGSRSPYAAADVISSVQSTDASVSAANPSTIQVSVSLTTQAQQSMTITRTLVSS